MESVPDRGSKDFSRRDFLKVAAGSLVLGAARIYPEGAKAETLEPNSPFSLENQEKVLRFVAGHMRIILDETRPLPQVIRAGSISDREFNKIIGLDTEGRRTNLFVPPLSIILMEGSKLHNLAHEYVHYLQFTYRHETDGSMDLLEDEAVRVQNAFRDKFRE